MRLSILIGDSKPIAALPDLDSVAVLIRFGRLRLTFVRPFVQLFTKPFPELVEVYFFLAGAQEKRQADDAAVLTEIKTDASASLPVDLDGYPPAVEFQVLGFVLSIHLNQACFSAKACITSTSACTLSLGKAL